MTAFNYAATLEYVRVVLLPSALLTYCAPCTTDTRILLTLLLDENARPLPKDMKLWVDVVRFIKRGAAGGPLGFFTYAELSQSFPPMLDSC